MKIIIVGGGITGLTTALALRKMGFKPTIYEKVSGLSEVGAGIMLQPNAMKVLDWLGIGGEIRANSIQLNSGELTDRKLVSFREISPEQNRGDVSTSINAIHRARLQQVLLDAFPSEDIFLGEEYLGHKENDKNIYLQHTTGQIKGNILLAADGIHSAVRTALFPKTKTRYAGQTCWRGISKMKLPEEYTMEAREMWGRGIRFGFTNISSDEVYWFAVAMAPGGEIDDKSIRKEMLQLKYKEFHPLVREIIERTPSDKIMRNDISDLKRLRSWHKGKVCLLGDAGHATTPNMGQGACQGIEDAYYFATILAQKEDYKLAFEEFEKLRRKKVDYVVNNSWMIGKIAHSPWRQMIMRTAMKFTPERVMKRQLDKLFHVDMIH